MCLLTEEPHELVRMLQSILFIVKLLGSSMPHLEPLSSAELGGRRGSDRNGHRVSSLHTIVSPYKALVPFLWEQVNALPTRYKIFNYVKEPIVDCVSVPGLIRVLSS